MARKSPTQIRPIPVHREHLVVVDRHVAEDIGLNEAIILTKVIHWEEGVAESHEDGDGSFGKKIDCDHPYWFYCSVDQWREDSFPFWSNDTIARGLANLQDMGLIVDDATYFKSPDGKRGSLNDDRRNRTKWYTVRWEHPALQAFSRNATTQNAEMQSSNMHECNYADCGDATTQNAELLIRTKSTSESTTKSTSESCDIADANIAGVNDSHSDTVAENRRRDWSKFTTPKNQTRSAPPESQASAPAKKPRKASSRNERVNGRFPEQQAELVEAYYRAMGVSRKDVAASTFAKAKNVLKDLPGHYTPMDVEHATRVLMERKFYADNPHALTPIKVKEELPKMAARVANGGSVRPQTEDERQRAILAKKHEDALRLERMGESS